MALGVVGSRPMSVLSLRCVVSVSGIRGIIGDTLNLDELLRLAAAYGTTLAPRGTVILGRDSRPTGAMVAQVVAAGLRGVGCRVIDIGIVPTPTVPIMISELGAQGGIQISASHNPAEWNALKLFTGAGRNVDQAELDQVIAAYAQPSDWQHYDTCGGYRTVDTAIDVHIARVLAQVDVGLIRAAKLRVVIDSVNGAGSAIAPKLLAALGCEVVPLYTRPDQLFPRDPEPTAANVRHLGGVVRAMDADVGFVQDPDADRLAIIDDRGRYIGEEYTLVLCAAARFAAENLAGRTGLVACTNLSTSRMLEDVATRFGGSVIRSKVGEAHVVGAMQKHQALIGGEGNGGIIDPRVVWGRDSQIGMALVLEYLARAKQPLSEVVGAIPAYAIHKEKIAVDRAGVTRAIEVVRSHPLAKGAELITLDGLKLVWPDRWVHLRASGTEPASRVIAEAPTPDAARELCATVRQAMGGVEVMTGH
jgi:phosphomannomutase